MDLSKIPNERKLYLCKWYFKGLFGAYISLRINNCLLIL